MIKRIFIWVLALSIIIAVWKVSGGNLGVAAANAWDFASNVLNITSNWVLTLWDHVNPF